MQSPLVARLALAGLLVGSIADPAAAQSDGSQGAQDSNRPRPRLKARQLAHPFAGGGTLRPDALFRQAEPRKLGVSVDETANGILVDRVVEDSLASVAGVEAGDILLSLAGQRLDVTGDIARALASVPAGGELEIGVVREGVGLMTLEAKLPEPEKKKDGTKDGSMSGGKGFLGIEIGDGDEHGVQVAGVLEGTAAWFAGLEQGDVLVSIDGKDVSSGEELVESIGGREAGAMVELAYVRDGERHESSVRLGRRRSSPLGFAAPFGDGAHVLPFMNQLHEGSAFAIPELKQLPGRMHRHFGQGADGDGGARFLFTPGGDGQDGLFFELPQMLEGHGIDLGEILDDVDVDLEDGGSLRIEIQDGEMTIDRDGDVRVFELDADDLEDVSFQWRGQAFGGAPNARGAHPSKGVWSFFRGPAGKGSKSFSRNWSSECEAAKECEAKQEAEHEEKAARLDPGAI